MIAPPDFQAFRPYLIRALHEWCTASGYTPYMSVWVDHTVEVPAEYVRDNEIVLNTSYDATSGLRITQDMVTFKARFGGVPRDIMVPLNRVMAVFAREKGEGMAFPILPDEQEAKQETPAHGAGPHGSSSAPADGAASALPEAGGGSPDDGEPPLKGRPALKRVK